MLPTGFETKPCDWLSGIHQQFEFGTSTVCVVTDRLISTSEGTESGAFVALDWGLIAFSGATWGASFLFMAEGLESYEPGAVTFVRVAFGFLTLTLVTRNRSPISREDWARILLLGFGWMAFPLTLFPIAQGRISSSLAGMINGAVPISVAIVASLLLRRLPGRWQQAGLFTGLMGLVLIGLPSIGDGGNSVVGVFLVITAVVSYGIAWNIAVPLQQKYGSLNVLWRVSSVALVLTLPYGRYGLSGSTAELIPTLSLVALGAGGTGLAYVAMVTLSGRTGSTRSSVTVYLTPPVAIVLGVWLRDETVESIALVGTALVLLGAWLTGRADDVD